MLNFKYYRNTVVVILWITCMSMCHLNAQTLADKLATQAPVVNTLTQPISQSPSQPPSQSQLVAQVGHQPITLADLNAITAKALQGISDPTIITRIQSQALNELINEYVTSQAFEAEMGNTTPAAISQLERLKRQVVMNYYLSSHVTNVPKPDARKIRNYLEKHPELVAGRQMFHFNQIVIHSSVSTNVDLIKELIKQDPTLWTLRQWLKDNRIPSEGNNFWRSSDQLNLVLVNILSTLKKGAFSVSQTKDQGSITVIRRFDAYPDPASVEEATANITRTYEQDTRNQIARNLIMQLRSKGGVQIWDQSLIPTNNPETIDTFETKNQLGKSLLLIWIFALLILVPAAVTVFYRQRISLGTPLNPPLEPLDNPEFADYQRKAKLMRRLLVIPILIPMVYWLYTPILEFFTRSPHEFKLQTIFSLAMIGLVCGSLIVISCFKIQKLRKHMSNGWLGLAILLAIELIFFSFDIHL